MINISWAKHRIQLNIYILREVYIPSSFCSGESNRAIFRQFLHQTVTISKHCIVVLHFFALDCIGKLCTLSILGSTSTLASIGQKLAQVSSPLTGLFSTKLRGGGLWWGGCSDGKFDLLSFSLIFCDLLFLPFFLRLLSWELWSALFLSF